MTIKKVLPCILAIMGLLFGAGVNHFRSSLAKEKFEKLFGFKPEQNQTTRIAVEIMLDKSSLECAESKEELKKNSTNWSNPKDQQEKFFYSCSGHEKRLEAAQRYGFISTPSK
jgi:hypothetical protein